MQSPASVLLLCMLTGSTCAVFYTKSNDNDYPRIGRRSFYTSGNGNHYPRIGRRDAVGSRLLLPGSADFSGFPGLDKRGVFTQGAYGYPRVGRSGTDMLGSEDLLAQRSSKLLEKFAARLSKHEEEEEDVIGKELQGSRDGDDVGPLNYPLSLMFLAFDTDMAVLYSCMTLTRACKCPSCRQSDIAQRCECCVYRQLGKRSGFDANPFSSRSISLQDEPSHQYSETRQNFDSNFDYSKRAPEVLPRSLPEGTSMLEQQGTVFDNNQKFLKKVLQYSTPNYLSDSFSLTDNSDVRGPNESSYDEIDWLANVLEGEAGQEHAAQALNRNFPKADDKTLDHASKEISGMLEFLEQLRDN